MSRSLIARNAVQYIGPLWQPGFTCAQEHIFSPSDLEQMQAGHHEQPVTRAALQAWLATHTGDCAAVTDFAASIGDTEYDWDHEESEGIYWACMDPSDDA